VTKTDESLSDTESTKSISDLNIFDILPTINDQEAFDKDFRSYLIREVDAFISLENETEIEETNEVAEVMVDNVHVKSELLSMPPYMGSCGTTAGIIAILDQIAEEKNVKEGDTVIINVDNGSYTGIMTAKKLRYNDTYGTFKSRFTWVIPVMGGFHLQMTLQKTIAKHLWHAEKIGSIGFWAKKLGRRINIEQKSLEYYPVRDLMSDVAMGYLRALIEEVYESMSEESRSTSEVVDEAISRFFSHDGYTETRSMKENTPVSEVQHRCSIVYS
jgi:hypothetical protein